MTPERSTRLAELIGRHETELLTDWLRVQQDSIARRRDLISDQELQAQSREFLALLTTALQQGGTTEVRLEGCWNGEQRWARNRTALASDLSDVRLTVTRE